MRWMNRSRKERERLGGLLGTEAESVWKGEAASTHLEQEA